MKKSLQLLTLLAVALLALTSCNNGEQKQKPVRKLPEKIYKAGKKTTSMQLATVAEPFTNSYNRCIDNKRIAFTDYRPEQRLLRGETYTAQGEPIDLKALVAEIQSGNYDYQFVNDEPIGIEPNRGDCGSRLPGLISGPVQQGGGGVSLTPTYPTGPAQGQPVLQNPMQQDEPSRLEKIWDKVWPILLVLLIAFILYWLFKIAHHSDRSWTARKKLEYVETLAKVKDAESKLTSSAPTTVVAAVPASEPKNESKEKSTDLPVVKNNELGEGQSQTPKLVRRVVVVMPNGRTTTEETFE